MSLPDLPVEFSRLIEADKIPAHGLELAIEAKPDELKALAKRLGLLSLQSLHAKMQINRANANTMVEVDGTLDAQMTQQCVVTLEPMSSSVAAEPFNCAYMGAEQFKDDGEETVIDFSAEDAEPIPADGMIDVGELVTQHLAMVIDPYPRKPGVEFTGYVGAEPASLSPFAGLAELTKKPKK
jgi:uncharacterized metal-binding protein YceD (DUF177 family)